MRIDRIEVYHVAMPLIYPFRTAFGNDECIESVLVKMVSDEDYGWGEGSPLQAPAYSPEWAGGVFVMVRDWLAPRIIGQDVGSGEELQRALSGVKGNYFAKAALDTAWWDLHARIQRRPLWELLGGYTPEVQVGADFGVMETLDGLLAEIARAQEAKFARVKLKYRPGWELDMISAVRQEFPDVVFHVDCNSAYTLDDIPMFRELDQYNLAMIEQPLAHDDLLDHSRLQRELETAVCLDESIVSLDKARKAIELEACRWVNIKVGRVGGLTNAVAIHDLCLEAGVPCWVGGMLESAVGQSHSLALATLPNFKYPADIFPTSRFYRQDLAEPGISLSGPSQITATDRPGIGCAPHSQRLERLLTAMAVVQ